MRASGVLPAEAPLLDQPVEGQLDGSVDHDDASRARRSRWTALSRGMSRTTTWSRPALGVAAGEHDGGDGRVGDGVQRRHRVGVGEGESGQRGPVEGAVGGQDARAEAVDEGS